MKAKKKRKYWLIGMLAATLLTAYFLFSLYSVDVSCKHNISLFPFCGNAQDRIIGAIYGMFMLPFVIGSRLFGG